MNPFRRRQTPFERRDDGDFDVRLDDSMRDLLANLLGQLRDLLSTDSPALERLFPPPYGDDEERNLGYSVLAGSELVEGKLEAIDSMESAIRTEVLTEDELYAWMRTVNDLRLVLGTILDVDEDSHRVAPEEDSAATYAAYEVLGVLLENIVWALSR